LVGSESIKGKVSIKIRTSQHRSPRYGGFDIVERVFSLIIPLEIGILANHLLQGFDNFGEIGGEFPHKVDLSEKKRLHGFLFME
jgi:hypothetical protein